MADLKKTILHDEHLRLNGKMIDFGGWDMPVNYGAGIIKEHVATRSSAGLFDVSHMGRFQISGHKAVDYLQYILTNNCADLKKGKAQYTIIQNEHGGAVDDAFLYKFNDEGYLLVVNASNRHKDMEHLKSKAGDYDVEIKDVSDAEGMIALQGPDSTAILNKASTTEVSDDMKRNELATIEIDDVSINISKTGYTGEKTGYELFIPAESTVGIWKKLITLGAAPAGLGARDTLRLEAGLPLYGHELGVTDEGYDIPIFAIPLSKFAVSFDKEKGNFYGKHALEKPVEKRLFPFELTGKGIPRAGFKVSKNGAEIGFVTSGTMLPDKRSIGLALLDLKANGNEIKVEPGVEIEVAIRNKMIPAKITKSNMK